jgi:hypothetical protein
MEFEAIQTQNPSNTLHFHPSNMGRFLDQKGQHTWTIISIYNMFQVESYTVIFIIKQTGCTNFTNLFWHENLHVSESSSVHHQEFIHCTLSNGICPTAVYKPVWHIPLLSVQWINSWWWTDELSETCRVSCQNKFVKLVHLVGFVIKKFVKMRGHMNVTLCSSFTLKIIYRTTHY